jgi:hypothetical protein
MKKKIVGIVVCMLMVLTTIPSVVSQLAVNEENAKPLNGFIQGTALIASIYLELDANDPQVQEIFENQAQIPQGFLANFDITLVDPNQHQDSDLIIAPLFRTIIGDSIGIGPFFKPIMPEETTKVHIRFLWGNIFLVQPDEDVLIVDGWAPLLSWVY